MSEAPPLYPLTGRKIWVAGHLGMVGSALVRRLKRENGILLTITKEEVDLRDQRAVNAWMRDQRPEAIFLAAGKVGGIAANETYAAEFLYDNLMIEANVIKAAFEIGTQKLLFLGSSCIYPRLAEQPIAEESLLTGRLEPTNEWYAIAKIAGVKLCQAYRRQYGADFISAMPTNLYGPDDKFDVQTSHVIPALFAKFHLAKLRGEPEVAIWGTGSPRREFLHVDDCADALVFMMKHYSDDMHLNIGCGADVTIDEIAHLIADVVGFTGEIVHDLTKPDGTPRKLLNVDRLTKLDWSPRIGLRDGLRSTYEWYRAAAPQAS